MLEWDPHKRTSAVNVLKHPWLSKPDKEIYKFTNEDYEEYIRNLKETHNFYENDSSNESSGNEKNILGNVEGID